MQKTITIPLEDYEDLKHKAELLEEIVGEEELTVTELEKIKRAEKTKKISEADFYSKHRELRC